MQYISISGPVAAGKTTLMKRLLEQLGERASAHEEKPEKNPFIREYYSDSRRWSFHSQIAFLSLYFDDRDYRTADKEFFFFDRCFIENLVLAKYRLLASDLTRDEYNTIEKIAFGMNEAMPVIDKYICIRCSIPLLCERLKIRGREYESELGVQYATLQRQVYDEWFESLPKDRTLIVDADEGIDLDAVYRFLEEN